VSRKSDRPDRGGVNILWIFSLHVFCFLFQHRLSAAYSFSETGNPLIQGTLEKKTENKKTENL
jgi:hypothetical protein